MGEGTFDFVMSLPPFVGFATLWRRVYHITIIFFTVVVG